MNEEKDEETLSHYKHLLSLARKTVMNAVDGMPTDSDPVVAALLMIFDVLCGIETELEHLNDKG